MKERLGRVRLVKLLYHQFCWQLYVLLAALLILIGVSKHPFIAQMRIEIANISAVIANVLYKPVEGIHHAREYVSEYLNVHDENQKLKQQNERLLFFMSKADQLARENQELKKQLNFVIPPPYKYWTGYILADNGGAFSSSVLIYVGRKDGIKKGFPVLFNDGLLGRIENVGYATSQILLLTDYVSRVPVMVGKDAYPAIVEGNNTPLLNLTFLPEGAVVHVGDYVATSGQGGVYPQGLAVGVVSKIDKDTIYVAPFVSRDDTQFVRVVDFNEGGLIDTQECAPCLCQNANVEGDGP